MPAFVGHLEAVLPRPRLGSGAAWLALPAIVRAIRRPSGSTLLIPGWIWHVAITPITPVAVIVVLGAIRSPGRWDHRVALSAGVWLVWPRGTSRVIVIVMVARVIVTRPAIARSIVGGLIGMCPLIAARVPTMAIIAISVMLMPVVTPPSILMPVVARRIVVGTSVAMPGLVAGAGVQRPWHELVLARVRLT